MLPGWPGCPATPCSPWIPSSPGSPADPGLPGGPLGPRSPGSPFITSTLLLSGTWDYILIFNIFNIYLITSYPLLSSS